MGFISWLKGIFRKTSPLQDHEGPGALGLRKGEAPISAEPNRPIGSVSEPISEQIILPRRQMVVGLDFGTSSTKVAYRWIGEDTATAFAPTEPYKDVPWFCLPTEIVELDGKIWMGRPTDDRTDLLSLKQRLLAGKLEGKKLVERDVCLYLAWVLEQVTRHACRVHSIPAFRPIINVGVPMAFHNQDHASKLLCQRYRKLAGLALACTSMMGGKGIQNGLLIEDAEATLEDARSRASEFEELVHVLPESIAAVVSYEKDRRSEPGAFGIVDIGAATTEIAVGILSYSQGMPYAQCYADSSTPVGAIAFQRAESSTNGGAHLEMLRSWWRQWDSTWTRASLKDRGIECRYQEWMAVSLFFTGGGGSHPAVKPYFAMQESPAQLSIQTYSPGSEVLTQEAGANGERDDFHLLAVAHGLSFHQRSEWPDWTSPAEVDVYPVDTSKEELEYTARGWV